MYQQVAVYGAGGFAREVAWLIQSCNVPSQTYEVTCFIDDNEVNWGKVLNGIPVVGFVETRERFPEARILLAIGSPQTREKLAQSVAAAGLSFETIIAPSVIRSDWIEIGTGTIICAGSILTTNITLGQQVQINLDCTIGHDVVIGDYATLAPGVHVSGCVHLGKRSYIGTGASIINGTSDEPIVIGDDVIVGAGACVTKTIPSGLTVVGVPAKPLAI